jgi:tetratricopeptide (TPR) repeat protein
VEAAGESEPQASRALAYLLLAALLAVTVLAFSGALGAALLNWDTGRYIVKNPLLRNAAGLAEIWNPFSRVLTKKFLQYYPLVFTSYWVEYQLGGTNALVYHATNVVLHLINVALGYLLVKRLGASDGVALGAAAIFAVHPVQVASVAWIAERKNLLAGLFYLTAFLLYLRHRRTGGRLAYSLALAAFAAALLSKTQAVTLPVAIVLYEAVGARPAGLAALAGRDVAARVAPMLALGLAAALVTMQVEGKMFLTWWDVPALEERPIVAATAAWFYVGKFLWPFDLAPIYPKWDVSIGNPLGWLAIAAWAAVATLAWAGRDRLPGLLLWGPGQFLLWVAPTLGLLPFGYQHFAHAADHFLYLSCLGGGVAVASVAERIAAARSAAGRKAVAGVGFAVVAALALRARQEVAYWRDDLTFFTRARDRNPSSYVANLNVGTHSWLAGRKAEAIAAYRRAMELSEPNGMEYNTVARRYLRALEGTQGIEAVLAAAAQELEKHPEAARVRIERARILVELGRLDEALADYDRAVQTAPRGRADWEFALQQRKRILQRIESGPRSVPPAEN